MGDDSRTVGVNDELLGDVEGTHDVMSCIVGTRSDRFVIVALSEM